MAFIDSNETKIFMSAIDNEVIKTLAYLRLPYYYG